MNIFKNLLFSSFVLGCMLFSSEAFAQKTSTAQPTTTSSTVEFTLEDIEKVKTLIEHHFKTRISDAEMAMYGKATEENLELYKLIDKTRKKDPFFSQPHISFIIDSMEERLGKKRPKSKSQLATPTNQSRNPKVSKLPRNKSDHY